MRFDADAAALRPLTRSLRAGHKALDVLAHRGAAERHGVLALLAHAALERGAREPSTTAAHLRGILRDAAVRHVLQDREVRRVTAALSGAGVRLMLLKGAQFAHALYNPPWLRPCTDIDLLVDVPDHEPATEVLRRLGYEPLLHVTGDAIFTQAHFSRVDAGMHHAVDLHWQALNPVPFRDALPFAELWDRGSAAGGSARGPCPVDALLLAAAHLAAHHADRPRLIWLADVDRLTARFSPEDWDAFVARAREARVCSAAVPVLRAAVEFFDAAVEERALRALAASMDGDGRAGAYLRQRRPAGRLWIEWRSLPTWRGRVRMIGQHLFPDREYMRQREGTAGSRWLAWAYARRAVTGAARWLAPSLFPRAAAPPRGRP